MKAFFAFVLVGLSLSSYSQPVQVEDKKNAIYLEGLGAAVAGLGVAYERQFRPLPALWLSGRGGISLVEAFTRVSPHIGGSVLLGKRYSFELGANYIIAPEIDDMDGAFQTLLGFRYQNPNDGFLFRIYFVPPLGAFEPEYLYIPYGGISIGKAF